MFPELRDVHGAARAVAYLTLAGAPYVAVTGVLTPGIGAAGITAVVAVALAMAVTGLICWIRPAAWPRFFWYVIPVLTTALVTTLNLATRDASTGAQLFYLWPVLYTANFLGRRAVYLILAMVFGGHAATVLTVLGAAKGMADWFAMILAMSMTALVVGGLRTRAERLRETLERQANADALTGLANRRSFAGALTRAGDWAARTHGRLALLTVDLDHFKTINDTYGHAAGDRALILVADALRAVAGDTGVAARLGGDEFVLLLRGDTPAASPAAFSASVFPADVLPSTFSVGGPPAAFPAGDSSSAVGVSLPPAGVSLPGAAGDALLRGGTHAVEVAQSLAAIVAADTGLPGGPPTLSIGIAELPGDAGTAEDLVKASDAALYRAKASGRGRIATAPVRLNPWPAPDQVAPDRVAPDRVAQDPRP
ncbi:diguanylate cyclase [Actinoplanes sp. N902-109]|uniref:GGDEF domain-containing protein n=1 Tax=Actinoplanes sp. (strain N902-109) TaxID=649831 RepID=UPI0003295308|nr:GGDEF domain-containing protein [Actinoplanes sp. N902-109]AGL18462.1 diguanylate cyclase [Actinoplanes sp. N902-109]